MLAIGSRDETAASRYGQALLYDTGTGVSHGSQWSYSSPVSKLKNSSPEGDRVLVGIADRTASIWPVGAAGTASPARALTLRGHLGEVLDIAFAPDGRTVATASADGTACMWDASPASSTSIIVSGGPAQPTTKPIFKDSQRVIIAGVDNRVRIVDVATGRSLGEPSRPIGPVAAMAAIPDGGKLATVGADRIGRMWEVRSWNLVREFAAHTEPLTAVAFSPDGGLLATASYDQTVRLFDVTNGAQIKKLTGHTAPVTGLAFNRDGTRLATAGLDNRVRVWNMDNYALLQTRDGYSSRIDQAIFSPDDRLITANMGIGASTEPKTGAARVIDVATGNELYLKGHVGTVLAAAFSPNDKTIVTAGFDRTVRLWDATTGEPRAVLYGHNARRQCCFQPKGFVFWRRTHSIGRGSSGASRGQSSSFAFPV